MFHMNAHQWVTSAEVDFNNQVNRMTHSVDTSHPLFPATSVTAHVPSGHGSKGRDCTWARQYELLLNKANLAIITTESSNCQQQRSTLTARYSTFLWSNEPATWWKVNCITSIMEGTEFCSYWNRHLLLIQICLPFMQCFHQNYHSQTQSLMYHHDIAHNIASDQENHFTAKTGAAMGLCSWK